MMGENAELILIPGQLMTTRGHVRFDSSYSQNFPAISTLLTLVVVLETHCANFTHGGAHT